MKEIGTLGVFIDTVGVWRANHFPPFCESECRREFLGARQGGQEQSFGVELLAISLLKTRGYFFYFWTKNNLLKKKGGGIFPLAFYFL